MSNVFLERQFEEMVTDDDLVSMASESSACFDLHRVDWQESFLSRDRTRLLCHYRAPDAESVRTALRSLNADMRVHWPGTVHDAPDRTPDEILDANVIVHRTFDDPVALEDLQAVEDENIGCLETHRVRFMRTFFSTDRRRMACLYKAPDAESVRIAQRQANMPFDSIWAFRRVSPDMLG
jgi:hypothetical protein